MTIPTEVIMRMATLGLSEAQAQAVADMMTAVESATAATFEANIEATKEKGRERWRKWKSAKSNVSKRLQTTAHVSQQLAGAEDNNSTTKIEPLSQKQTAASRGVAEFKAKLAPLLDADLLDAFVSVRKAKRGAMTGYAAGLFIGDAERCGMSVPEAAKECVRSSWITVKPEYFAGRPRASPAQAPSLADVFAHAGTKVTSHENQPGPQEDRSGFREAISHLSAVRTG